MSTIAAALATGVVAIASPAQAQPFEPLHARLDYDRGEFRGCYDEEVFRLYVAARLGGQDPFTPDAPKLIKVKVRRRGGLYVATAEMYDRDGKRLGDASSERIAYMDCRDTVERAGGIVVTWLMPIFVKPARPQPPPCPTCPACPLPPPASRLDVWPREWPLPPLQKPEPDPPKPPERAPLSFRVGAGAWADYISDSGGSLGLTLDAGVRWHAFSVAGEGRWDPALATGSYGEGAFAGGLRFSRATGALMACAHHSVLVGCLKGQGGRVWFPGSSPPLPAISYAAAGVRVGLEFPVASRFIVRLDGELLPTINPESALLSNQTVFQVARLNAGLGLGALFDLGRQ